MAANLISLTPAALDHARRLLLGAAEAPLGIRLGIKPTGCSGYSYRLDFARSIEPGDAVVEHEGVRLIVAAEATELVAGTEVDFVEDQLGAQFVFRNPRERARCGCGESFSV